MKTVRWTQAFQLLLCIIVCCIYAQSASRQNRCDERTSEETITDCINCRSNIRARCPSGFTKTTRGQGRRGCRYRIRVGGSTRPARGCSHKCVRQVSRRRCCSGFWGQDCQPCPSEHDGGPACSGRGTCNGGLRGNGTCTCRGRVSGSACEVCADNNHQYGPSCEHDCSCVHGKCDSGVDRPGTCSCDSGYGGAQCNIVLAACANLNCHTNSRCLNDTGVLHCRCNSGYAGDGTNCTSINPCQDTGSNLCHKDADCIHSGPAQYDCRCQEGYSGDGRFCQPIDPCQTNYGGCPRNSTTCNYTGPGKSKCFCKIGYNSTKNSDVRTTGCSLISICGRDSNTTCDRRATCVTVDISGSIQVQCKCPINLLARGLRCYSDLLTEIANANDTGPFANRLNKALQMFRSTYFHQLVYSSSTFTIIVPADGAFGSELGEPGSSTTWKARARAHIIPTMIDLDFSHQTAISLYPLLGSQQSIKALQPTGPDDNQDDDDSQYVASLKYGITRITGEILTRSNWASDGVFYISDTLLEPPSPPDSFPSKVYDARNMTLLQALENLSTASEFLKLLKLSYNVRDFMRNELDTFTLLLPDNQAFSNMPADAMKALTNVENTEKLDAVLAHHIVVGAIETMALIDDTSIVTTSDTLTVQVSADNGIVYIGQEKAKVLLSEIPVAGGSFIYFIDKVLIPGVAKPLVNNFCTRVVPSTIQGNCGDCSNVENLCSSGVVKPDRSSSRCIYVGEAMISQSGIVGQRLGCRPHCIINRTESTCCIGFYGKNCRSCPGPLGSPCNGHGVCDDGMSDYGQCHCNEGYTGSACSICANSFQFGSGCNQNCTCLYGVCDNTINSRGICKLHSCHAGWAGEDCDRQAQACGTGSMQCHQHAVCLAIDGTEICQCEPGYTGDGANCYEFDPCVDNDYRGGCDVNGVCWNLGKGNTSCTCKQFYTGDGKSCTAINPCDTNNGGCDANADCIFIYAGKSSCRCKDGYRGSGLICAEINKCLENNGGCHLRAQCDNTGPGTRRCTCLNSYDGDGINCVGTLIMEISEHAELSMIKHWIDTVPSVENLFRSVQHSTSVTAFLPQDQAWRSMNRDDYRFWLNSNHLPILLKHHLVNGPHSTRTIHKNEKLDTLLEVAPIAVSNITSDSVIKNVQLNSSVDIQLPTLGQANAKITVPDLKTINGFVHIIDEVLLPNRDVVKDYPTLTDAIQGRRNASTLLPYSSFLTLMNNSGVIAKILDTDTPYTIFALKNGSFDPNALSVNAKLILEYHVIPGKLIRSEAVQTGQHETTLAGSGYKVTLTRLHGELYVNKKAVGRSGVRTQRGIIYNMPYEFLTPVKSRCDRNTSQLTLLPCLPCVSLSPGTDAPCGKGDKRIVVGRCRMSGSIWTRLPSTWTSKMGCRAFCRKKTLEKKCCPGFYGAACEPCPGGVGNACANNGVCFDGLNGNGTCSCSNLNFSGNACNECAPGLFGDDCENTCNCVKGTCLYGRSGSGHCICNEGYTGLACDEKHNPNDACGGKCHTSSKCYSQVLPPRCICAEGYTGNGTVCLPINPCDSPLHGGCHTFAKCHYRGPGQRRCTCKPGYQGNGIYCVEINPCVAANFSKCDKNADCFHVGPNRANCICRNSYTGDGKTCSPVNPCENNKGGCHIFATCEQTGPGTRSCKCFEDYFGDGVSFCRGSIFHEFRGNPKFSWISNNPVAAAVLSSPGPITAFLQALSPGQNSATKVKFSLSNVVGCVALNFTMLKSARSLKSLDGKTINVTTSGDSVTLNGNVRVKMAADQKLYANGFLFEIEGDMIPPPPLLLASNKSSQTSRSKNIALFQELGANELAKIMDQAGIFNILDHTAHGQWTIFIPTDSAFNQLSTFRKRQLTVEQSMAREFIKYHMIWPSFIHPTDVIRMQELTTMQGSSISIKCSRRSTGEFVLNGGAARVLKFQSAKIYTLSGSNDAAFYWIDKVLEPPSVGGRCDIVTNATTDGTCGICHNGPMPCPNGLINVGVKNKLCPTAYGSSVAGCQAICMFTNITKKCCKGYYGKDCHPCPGGAGNVCSGNGECKDGINGTGKCICKSGFTGYACERCEHGRFGYDCSPCQCSVHGTCSWGMEENGSCFCDEGYTGVSCDQKIVHPTNCSPPCVKNAVCVVGGQCLCEPPYTGLGTKGCDIPDLCDDNTNGGCSNHAICRQDQLQVTCTCKPPYVGDGYVCEGFDPCANGSLLCHAFARCVYVGPNRTRCDCFTGYYGDGVRSCELAPKARGESPTTCAVNRGGCSRNAHCVDLPRRTRNEVPRVNCTCKEGFTGDGVTCNGNVFQVLAQGLYPTAKFYQKILRNRNPQLLLTLRNAKKVTLFVPDDSSYTFRKLRRRVLMRHIKTGSILTTAHLKTVKVVQVDSGDALPVQVFSGRTVYINGVQMITSDIPATNGIIHILKGVISSKFTKFTPTASPAVTTTRTTTKSHRSSSYTPPIDEGGIPANVTSPSINVSQSTKATFEPGKPPTKKKATSSGVKVGIALGIVVLVMLIVFVLYWKKRNSSFVFRPLLERARNTGRSEDVFDDQPTATGMMNPAYDSTAFSDVHAVEPADFELSQIPTLPMDEDEDHQALMKFDDSVAD